MHSNNRLWAKVSSHHPQQKASWGLPKYWHTSAAVRKHLEYASETMELYPLITRQNCLAYLENSLGDDQLQILPIVQVQHNGLPILSWHLQLPIEIVLLLPQQILWGPVQPTLSHSNALGLLDFVFKLLSWNRLWLGLGLNTVCERTLVSTSICSGAVTNGHNPENRANSWLQCYCLHMLRTASGLYFRWSANILMWEYTLMPVAFRVYHLLVNIVPKFQVLWLCHPSQQWQQRNPPQHSWETGWGKMDISPLTLHPRGFSGRWNRGWGDIYVHIRGIQSELHDQSPTVPLLIQNQTRHEILQDSSHWIKPHWQLVDAKHSWHWHHHHFSSLRGPGGPAQTQSSCAASIRITSSFTVTHLERLHNSIIPTIFTPHNIEGLVRTS